MESGLFRENPGEGSRSVNLETKYLVGAARSQHVLAVLEPNVNLDPVKASIQTRDGEMQCARPILLTLLREHDLSLAISDVEPVQFKLFGGDCLRLQKKHRFGEWCARLGLRSINHVCRFVFSLLFVCRSGIHFYQIVSV